jgi:hypothetical protein
MARPDAMVKKASVAAAMGATLMGCSSSSDTGQGPQTQQDAGGGDDALSDVFAQDSAEDIAQQLDAMVESGEAGDDGPQPLYKGVTF